MTWSLNEIDALSRKAARGAGFPWGHAEEAGKAVRWLEARKLPGGAALARLLSSTDGKDLARLTPFPAPHVWTAACGRICPIHAGTMLADGMVAAAVAAEGSGSLVLTDVNVPILLLPFLAWMAEAQDSPVALDLSGSPISLSPNGALCALAEIPEVPAASVTLRFGAGVTGQPIRAGFRSNCPAETISALTRFAQRTYAPATEQSRLAGAGAGLTDND